MTDSSTQTSENKTPSIATAKIEVWLAGVLMLLAFAVGFLLHGVTNPPSTPAPVQPITGLPGGVVPAGPLTNNQLQGGLPPNHPEVVPGQTVPGAPAPSTTGGGNGNGNNNP